MARARVEPIFLSAVAPSYEEMKLPCTLSATCFFLLLSARFRLCHGGYVEGLPFLSRSCDRPDVYLPSIRRRRHRRRRVRFHLVTPVFPVDIHLGGIQ